MAGFTLELLADDPLHLDASRHHLMERAKEFKRRYCADHVGAEYDARTAEIFLDLESTRFWGVLAALDGPNPSYGLHDPYLARGSSFREGYTPEKIRTWACASFTEYNLQELLTICINQALIRPKETSWPGTGRAHSILYQALVEKKDSIFSGVVGEDFRKHLENGRLWEELGRNRAVAHEVLTDHAQDLDPLFAKKGYALLLASGGVSLSYAPRLDLRMMATKTLDRYIRFVVDVAKHGQIDTGLLVGAYAHAILDRHTGIPYVDAGRDGVIDDVALQCRLAYLPLVARTLIADVSARRDVIAALHVKRVCSGPSAAQSLIRLLPAQDTFRKEFVVSSAGRGY